MESCLSDDKCDHKVKSESVQRCPKIYLAVEENPEKPQLRNSLKIVHPVVTSNWDLTSRKRRYNRTEHRGERKKFIENTESIANCGLGPTYHSLIFTCPQTEVKEHPVSLRVTCGKHAKFPGRCWVSRPGLLLQISSYTNFS